VSEGTRTYRLRIYDGEYEVLHTRRHVIDLDPCSPGRDITLTTHLAALTRAARAAGEPMDAPRLEVWDEETSTRVLDWCAG
jgi:hypothetical protein